MEKIEAGEFLVTDKQEHNVRTIITGKVNLDISYTEQVEVEVKNGKNYNNFQHLRIFTDNEGGGNYFRIQTGMGNDSEDESESTFAVENLDELKVLIDDFKKRYNKLLK